MTRERAIEVLEYSKEAYEGMSYGAPRIALDMAIAALREQPQWISVDERLPGEDFLDKEIIVCKLNRFGGRLVYVTRFWGTHSALWNDITHWMPLPEPPKEEV